MGFEGCWSKRGLSVAVDPRYVFGGGTEDCTRGACAPQLDGVDSHTLRAGRAASRSGFSVLLRNFDLAKRGRVRNGFRRAANRASTQEGITAAQGSGARSCGGKT